MPFKHYLLVSCIFSIRGNHGDITIDSFLTLTLKQIFPQVEKSKVKVGVLFIVGNFSKIKF